ncbi:MAG: hypothetical protein AAF390_17830 [Pseudomonadota bacterium]
MVDGIGEVGIGAMELTPEQEAQAAEAVGFMMLGTLMSNQRVADKIAEGARDEFERIINGG